MLFTSPVYSQVSGSIAGITYGHGRSGMFTRSRSTPTNPSSTMQQTIRSAIRTLAPYWGQTLDATQRAAWNLYASNVPWTNALGQTIFLTGIQHFIRCNVVRIQAGIAILAAAPTIYDLGTFTTPTFTYLSNAPTIQIGVTDTDHWATHTDGYCLLFSGKPVGQGIKYYATPWRYVDKIAGDPITPPTGAEFLGVWPFELPNQGWCYTRIIQVDGRLSSPSILGPRDVESE